MAKPLDGTADANEAGEEIARDLRCLNCGYNLRGLSTKGRCPECGATIELSILAADDPIADRKWIRGTVVGVRMYSVTLMVALVLIAGSAGAEYFRWHPGIGEGLLHVAFAGGAAVAAVAVWLSTRYAEHEWDWHSIRWFWGLRFVSGVAALAAMAYSVAMVSGSGWRFGGASGWFQSISGGVAAWGIFLTDAMFMSYLAKLVRRLPGHLRLWGYVTAARIPMLFPLGCLMTMPSGGRPSGFVDSIVLPVIIFLVMPMCLFIWPAAYAWIWARRVEARTRE